MRGKDLIAATLFGGGGGSSGGGGGAGGGVKTGTITIAEDVSLADRPTVPIVTHNLGRDIAGVATIVEHGPLSKDGYYDEFLYVDVLYSSLSTDDFFVYYHTASNSSSSIKMAYMEKDDALKYVKLDENRCYLPLNHSDIRGKWLAGMTIRWFVW